MSPMFWAILVPICLILSWFVIRRPVREVVEELHVERARDLFRIRREGLEARFLSSVGRLDPAEKLRWDDARWRDEVVWARDRKSRA